MIQQQKHSNEYMCLIELTLSQKQLNSPYLKGQTKCVVHKALTRPILTYGSEWWPLSKKDGNMIRKFERKMLRMM
jgi:hypothetical protein